MIREKVPDKMKALSLIESAEKDMQFTLSLKISEASANTIVRNIYESFRMLGEALLIFKGLEPLDHRVCIDEILKLNVDTERPLNLLDGLRRLRHTINYYGYRASEKEALNTRLIAKNCFYPVLGKINEILGEKKK